MALIKEKRRHFILLLVKVILLWSLRSSKRVQSLTERMKWDSLLCTPHALMVMLNLLLNT